MRVGKRISTVKKIIIPEAFFSGQLSNLYLSLRPTDYQQAIDSALATSHPKSP